MKEGEKRRRGKAEVDDDKSSWDGDGMTWKEAERGKEEEEEANQGRPNSDTRTLGLTKLSTGCYTHLYYNFN